MSDEENIIHISGKEATKMQMLDQWLKELIYPGKITNLLDLMVIKKVILVVRLVPEKAGLEKIGSEVMIYQMVNLTKKPGIESYMQSLVMK